ncbi:MAG: phosphoribosylformylglycinamidine cyclo-ligase, partial [Candidatus Izemoplasmatales bacterium]|nr:phosphoribosylformylglycinamidine cyclo-ligase [Candidatus Izemoplasmatales bacterium]
MSEKYRDSGVDIENGYLAVKKIKSLTKKTNNLGVINDIGAFGGMFDLSRYHVKEPILVSGTDGVGTKLLIAQKANKHDTIGIDLVAMCVNDIITVLAKPLFFLDYIALGILNPDLVEKIVQGITLGCIEAGCALIGGETAEMPDMYSKDHYDLAGYVTGVVEKSEIITVDNVLEGDSLIGIKSSGLHSNGFSLVRKILFKDNNISLDDYIPQLDSVLKDVLLAPTRIYVKAIETLSKNVKVHGISHITGGGFIENIPRMLPGNLGAEIHENAYPSQPIFKYLEALGKIPHQEMFNVFNMGIGMVIAINDKDVDKSIECLKKEGYDAYKIGKVVNGQGV